MSTVVDSADRYDYIVVGAGSSGSVVAAELAADPAVRVLVLEGGDGEAQNPEILVAAKYKDAFINDRLLRAMVRADCPPKHRCPHPGSALVMLHVSTRPRSTHILSGWIGKVGWGDPQTQSRSAP